MDPIDDDAVLRAHGGDWRYHPDDCRCAFFDLYCNRDGWVWSCCGASKEHSDCSAPVTHPTHWGHPRHAETVAGWDGVWPRYRSNAEIRSVAPECFTRLSEPGGG